MPSLIDVVLEWPAIVQGAIGSALFSFILVAGQRLFEWGGTRLAFISSKFKEENLYREYIHKKVAQGSRRHEMLSMCTYQALSYLVRGFVFLGIGLSLSGFFPLGNTVGGLGFLFYSFRALGWLKPYYVGPAESDLELWNRIKDIELQLFGAIKEDTESKLRELQSS